jgi:cytidylate kinase
MRREVSLDDVEAVADLARGVDLEVGDHVLVDGVDATAAIRTPEVTAAVSKVAANSGVRSELRARQQHWAAERGGGVIEGRDIGSVVFPDADLKLYLTASPRVRAERRVAELGDTAGDVDEIERAIAARDHYDSTRTDSPLTEATGSTLVDTTGRTIPEVLAHILQLLEHR